MPSWNGTLTGEGNERVGASAHARCGRSRRSFHWFVQGLDPIERAPSPPGSREATDDIARGYSIWRDWDGSEFACVFDLASPHPEVVV